MSKGERDAHKVLQSLHRKAKRKVKLKLILAKYPRGCNYVVDIKITIYKAMLASVDGARAVQWLKEILKAGPQRLSDLRHAYNVYA